MKAGSRPKGNRDRPFTNDTWILVAILMDEEQMTVEEIADELVRNPKHIRAELTKAKRTGKLEAARDYLMDHRGVYAIRQNK